MDFDFYIYFEAVCRTDVLREKKTFATHKTIILVLPGAYTLLPGVLPVRPRVIYRGKKKTEW